MKLDISVWVPFCFLSNLYWRFFFFRRINNQRPKGKIRNETWNCQRHSLNPGCRWFGLQRTTRKLYPPLRAIDWSMQDDWCKRSHADARCLAANTTVVCEGWPHLANTLLSSPGNVRRGGNPPLCIRRDSLIPSVAEPSAESPAVPTKTGLRFFLMRSNGWHADLPHRLRHARFFYPCRIVCPICRSIPTLILHVVTSKTFTQTHPAAILTIQTHQSRKLRHSLRNECRR